MTRKRLAWPEYTSRLEEGFVVSIELGQGGVVQRAVAKELGGAGSACAVAGTRCSHGPMQICRLTLMNPFDVHVRALIRHSIQCRSHVTTHMSKVLPQAGQA